MRDARVTPADPERVRERFRLVVARAVERTDREHAAHLARLRPVRPAPRPTATAPVWPHPRRRPPEDAA
jgi:hypothetical protein